MRLPRVRWFSVILLLVVAVTSVQAVKLLGAEPPTTPRATDIANARRNAPPPSGQIDDQEPSPPAAAVSGNGVVEPAQPETRVGAASAGTIARIAVQEGQRVVAGELLVELDRRVEAGALAAAESEVVAARAELDRAVRGSRAEDIKAARADADAARSRSALAVGVLERVERAAASGAITGDELDRTRREAEAAQAGTRAASAREQATISGSRREDIQLARAKLVTAEARRDQAAAIHDRMAVRSPVAGEVLQVKYRAGEYYQPTGEPLVLVGETASLRVRVDIDERDIGKIAVGSAVIVRASAFPGVDHAGRIVAVGRRMGRKNVRVDDPTERNDTKVLEVLVALDTPRALLVGLRVTCYVASPSASK